MTNSNAIEVISHRGASGYAPENTVTAILKGIELKSNYIEIDVHMSKDGKIIAFHDDTLGRTTSGKGKVKDKTLSELKKLDAGSWFASKYSAETIPALSEILRLDFKESGLIIEVKNVNNTYPGIEEKIAALVEKSKFQNKIIYKSFSTEVLEKFHELDPHREKLYVTIGPIFSWLIIDDWIRFGSIFDLEFVNLIQIHKFLITESVVRSAHAKGKKVIAWDVHSPDAIRKMKNLKVDMIETDYPDRINQ